MHFESFQSYRIDTLVDLLVERPLGTIIVPNSHMRQWLLLEIAKRKGIAMGIKIVQIDQLYSPISSRLDFFCSIYSALRNSSREELKLYIAGKDKKLVHLTQELAPLFLSYYEFQLEIPDGWQKEIFNTLSFSNPLPIEAEVICFGIDFLPPLYLQFLSKAKKVTFYLFSPCVEFWEDICSHRERKNLLRYWEKRGAAASKREALDSYLREGPKNLAAWGKLGKLMQGMLASYDLHVEESYPDLESTTSLNAIKYNLLTFQEGDKIKADDSIKVFLTGSSKLREVQVLYEEIIRSKIPYHEISVLAPDITPYLPFIEFVFGDKIPFRISGFDIGSRSSFRQGLLHLVGLTAVRWNAEAILTLFETPSFYRKMGWKQKTLEIFRQWIENMPIQWGMDQNHRAEILTELFGDKEYIDEGSWERGLDELLNAAVTLSPLEVDLDLFEQLIVVLHSLRMVHFKGDRTLQQWGEILGGLATQFLVVDPDDEADQAAYNDFTQLLSDLRNTEHEAPFPLAVVETFLKKSVMGQKNSSFLHAVRFSSLEIGALIAAKALFLIGMDEESFPRTVLSSSLNLAKGKCPVKTDFDRYLFLQALFSAQDILRISYNHLSPDEGKPVGPSLVVQELLSSLDLEPILSSRPSQSLEKKNLVWPRKGEFSLPKGNIIVPISDLRLLARNPWKFYLQKVLGIYLDIDLEESFALQRGLALRDKQVPLPPGRLKAVLLSEVMEKKQEWKRQLEVWGLAPSVSLFNRETAVELYWDQLTVSLVGEVENATPEGLISFNDDSISGVLKIWPEAIIAGSQIGILKSGKMKQIAKREEALRLFVEYYFQCLVAPSPLISDWADSFLRKGVRELEKKIEKGATFEDPVVSWVLARIDLPSSQEMFDEWESLFKKTFASLIELYPTRTHATI